MSDTLTKYETVTTLGRLQWYADQAREQGIIAFDTETTGLNPHTADLVGIALALPTGEACYVPIGHSQSNVQQLKLEDIIGVLAPILANPMITKVLQNAKYDIHVMHRYGVVISGVEDTMLYSYAMFAGKHRHNMDELSKRYLQHTPISFSEVTGSGPYKLTFDEVDIDAATIYSAEDADVTLRLFQKFAGEMEPWSREILDQYDAPLLPVLVEMERAGIAVNREQLEAFGKLCDETIAVLKAKLQRLAGFDFNPASPNQVGVALLSAGVRKNDLLDNGKVSTSVEVLKDVANSQHIPERARILIETLLSFRKWAKLKGTYVDGLLASLDPTTDRVHTSFIQVGTITGRLASSDPNLQNIPIRTLEGKEIRKAFIAKPGHKLISADYSQIELRVLAHVCGDEPLKRAFENGIDIHTATASEVWMVPVEDVDKDMRRNAKAVNFGIVYGSSAFGLSRNLGIGVEEAEGIIARYFQKFPGIRGYMVGSVNFARLHGYVETLAGRRIWLPDIKHQFKGKRGHAERQAVNAPIQGTAADIIKAAMIDVADMLRREKLRTRLLLSVHDELVFEAPDDEVEIVKPLIKATMENCYQLSVPLVVDVGVGDNWHEAHR